MKQTTRLFAVIGALGAGLWWGSSEKAQAETKVSGPITTAVTWSDEILVTGDVTVAAGGKLTIAPGSIVRFALTGDDQKAGTNKARVEFTVNEGELDASGTFAQPIRFTPNTTAPVAGNWLGLVLKAGAVTLKWCNLDYASIPLTVNAGGAVVEDSTFLKSASTALAVGAKQTLSVKGCKFTDGNDGVSVAADADVTIHNCTLSAFRSAALQQAPGSKATVTNSLFEGNLYGVLATTATTNVTDSIVTKGTNSAFIVNGALKLLRCEVSGNAGSGIATTGNPLVISRAGVDIADCSFINNKQYGLTLGNLTSVVTGCRITGNNYGIGFGYVEAKGEVNLGGNDIYDNKLIDLNNTSKTSIVLAKSNYLGPVTTQELMANQVNLSKITDIKDKNTLGQILIQSFSETSLAAPTAPAGPTGNEPVILMGDLNSDGVVNIKDALLALKIAVGLTTPTPYQLRAGDLTGDGRLSTADVTKILRAAVGG